MRSTKKRPTSPVEQILVSLGVIVFGGALCLIPLLLGLNVQANIGGNRGPGGAAALIVGGLLIVFGLIGLIIGTVRIVWKLLGEN